MSKTLRVHNLARELSVSSKTIVQKCADEGIELKNHMAILSAGLAATIREWFSEGQQNTAVETAKPVDLEKVRVRKKKLKTVTKEQPAPPESQITEAPPQPQIAPPPPVETETTGKSVTPATLPDIEPPQPEIVPPPIPKPPKPIKPAGPKLKTPTPAKLTGPTIIRVESVEVKRPRPKKVKPAPRPGHYNRPTTEPLMLTAEKPAKGKKGAKEKARGKHDDVSESDKGGKLDTKRMRSRDMEERQARLAAARGETLRSRPLRRIESRTAEGVHFAVERPEKATISEPITIKDLSAAIAVKIPELISKLMRMGVMAAANHTIAAETAELLALEFGTELQVQRKNTLLEQIQQQFEERPRTRLENRPPVVTMLGHVDHGKTSLLDRIRSTSVAKGEAGGITQHIGAYMVEWKGRRVAFLDTPGHEAFTAMRARGADMTDIAVLVVAADDGLMPQTIEAIHHAKAAEVEIIVALNKIDLPGVDINRIHGQLAEHELTPAEWSGNTEIVKTSATTGQGIEELIEHLDYIADLKDYKADPTIPATGWVVEAKMSASRGPVATVLLKEGHLNKGDIVLAGSAYGKIRIMTDSRGKNIKKATPSMPVEISGLNAVPQAGDRFYCLDDLNLAKQAAEQQQVLNREQALGRRSHITLDNLFSQIEAGSIKELNLVLRADVQGSVDVLTKYLTELSTERVKVKILHAGVGGITEGDVVLAEASSAIVIGFNVVPDDRVRQIADAGGVDIRLYSIIYRITEDLKAAMEGLLDPEYEEQTLGRLVVRTTFKVSTVGTIAGCFVSSGSISKNAKLRLIRNNIVIKDDCSIESLRHFKDDVRDVRAGLECGIKIAGYDDVKVDDAIEAYEIVQIARSL